MAELCASGKAGKEGRREAWSERGIRDTGVANLGGGDDGFASAWMSNIFGLDALTSLAVAGSQVPGIELGTAVVPTYPRHPVAMAQAALSASAVSRCDDGGIAPSRIAT